MEEDIDSGMAPKLREFFGVAPKANISYHIYLKGKRGCVIAHSWAGLNRLIPIKKIDLN